MAKDADPSALPPQATPPSPSEKPSGATPDEQNGSFPVVGIGASAGGLEAFTQLLQPLPSDPGLAFILVQHLDPTRESMLPELLSRVTPMLVQQVQDGMVVQPNQVYIAPPQADVVISDRVLKLVSRSETRGLHMPIDVFFRSLANDQGPHAIGIVLSGAGSDGALGLQAIKEHGGLSFVQDERTATFAGMPHSAIRHGSIDFIMPPQKMAEELIQIAQHPYVANSPEADMEESTSLLLLSDREAWGQILKLLQRVKGINFTAYKPSTIQRRIARRMALHNMQQPGEYVRSLLSNREELEALYHDLFIKVTSFFRDPDSFEALKREALPRLMVARPRHRPLRIWVPGCATGEEAYSLAICILEFLGDETVQESIRLFATDIDELSLAKARTGLYIENIALDVSPERLRRFFVKVDQHYQIIQAIREMCIFAKHNLYQDPPFSNLDLISCRNVLIYLEAATQRRVMPLFHYALQPNGVLTLGPAETIGTFSDLFTLVDSKHKIYTKKATVLPATLDFFRHVGREEVERTPAAGQAVDVSQPWRVIDLSREAERALLSRYAPAAVLVSDAMEILHFHGNTDRYLRPAPGKATLNLFRMARQGLLSDLRLAIDQAGRTGSAVNREGVQVRAGDTWHEVTIRITPLALPPPISHYLVVFEESVAPATPTGPRTRRRKKAPQEEDPTQIARLQQELDATQQYLQTLMEQHEAANEELKAANEEVTSSNEELQSTNEELETAKEELQSMNEELLTTNDELRHRNSDLSLANSDLTNLFGSVQLPIIIVGYDLRIRRFTTMAEKVLHLIPTDIGRPVGQLQLNTAIPELESMILQVVDTVRTREREIQDREGHWYSLRIRPYRTSDNKIDGAVLLFVDIDSLKNIDRLTQLLEEVDKGRKYADAIVQTVREPLVILDHVLTVRTANRAFYETFQVFPEQTEGRALYSLGNGQWDIRRLRELLAQCISHGMEVRDYDIEQSFETIGTRIMRLNARRLEQQGTSEILILLAIEDISELKHALDQAHDALREKELLLRELHHRVQNNLQIVSRLLSLRAGRFEDPIVHAAFEESQLYIQSIALVHEQLNTSPPSSVIHMREYIERLARQLFDAHAAADHISLHLHLDDAPITMETAIPSALILTELLSNVLQHAYPVGQQGDVWVSWSADGEDHQLLMVKDSGMGMPPDTDLADPNSLGLGIVRTLVNQLGGSMEVDLTGGTTVTIRFPCARA